MTVITRLSDDYVQPMKLPRNASAYLEWRNKKYLGICLVVEYIIEATNPFKTLQNKGCLPLETQLWQAFLRTLCGAASRKFDAKFVDNALN